MRAVLVSVITSGALLAQQQEPVATLRSGTEEVLLDVIVRDRGGHMVRDLRPDEVEIYEDGARQQVRGFRFVGGDLPEGAPGGATPARTGPGLPWDPSREVNLVTIVIEAMGRDARVLGRQVLNEFLDHGLHSNTWVAVFFLGRRLEPVQLYTRDAQQLRTAVDLVMTGNMQDVASRSNRILLQLLGMGDLDVPETEGDKWTGARRMEMQVMMFDEGLRTLDALRHIVRVQAAMPGRKTVLYLSDGLVLPPGMTDLILGITSEAVRSNVSFYTMHTAGLTMGLRPEDMPQIRDGGGAVSLRNEAPNREFGLQTDPAFERLNPERNLIELAEATGGFAMTRSNDLRVPMRRVMEEVRSHYEVTYSPASTEYDGAFRKIEVRVKRRGLRAQTRDGYFALPLLDGRSLLPHEYAVLRAMEANPRPASLPFRLAALRMRPVDDAVTYSVTFEIPAGALKIEKGRARASLLALVRDGSGRVVDRVSRDLALEVPQASLEEFRRGPLTVSLPVLLRPGRYTVSAGVVDLVAGTAGVRKSALTVAAREPLPVSDLVVVRRLDRSAERDPLNGLQCAAGVVTPQLATSVKSAPWLYLNTWPKRRDPAKCTLQIRHDGQVVATLRPELGPPDASGAAPLLIQLPADKLEPGQYEVAALVEQGEARSGRMTTFAVEGP